MNENRDEMKLLSVRPLVSHLMRVFVKGFTAIALDLLTFVNGDCVRGLSAG